MAFRPARLSVCVSFPTTGCAIRASEASERPECDSVDCKVSLVFTRSHFRWSWRRLAEKDSDWSFSGWTVSDFSNLSSSAALHGGMSHWEERMSRKTRSSRSLETVDKKKKKRARADLLRHTDTKSVHDVCVDVTVSFVSLLLIKRIRVSCPSPDSGAESGPRPAGS